VIYCKGMEIIHKGLRVGGLVETNGSSEFHDGTVGLIIKIVHFKWYAEYTVLIDEEKWVLSNSELIDGTKN